MTDVYVIAASRTWNRAVFDEIRASHPGEWILVDDPARLTADHLSALRPRYVFLLHWSWKVPKEVFEAYECVAFHMTDLPYGRGGSPLQNLILRGHRQTTLSAFRVVEEIDAGPVYVKVPLSLQGTAEDIYRRASRLAADLIGTILQLHPIPSPQQGEVVTFRRREPSDSRLPEYATAEQLYDFIRMLDADGYPRAFVESATWRCEFSRASLDGDTVRAEARLLPIGRPDAS
jgi:methionyl-tRNA formyltransferase